LCCLLVGCRRSRLGAVECTSALEGSDDAIQDDPRLLGHLVGGGVARQGQNPDWVHEVHRGTGLGDLADDHVAGEQGASRWLEVDNPLQLDTHVESGVSSVDRTAQE
jgi:hypothetical protein